MSYLLATLANDADYMPAHLFALEGELVASETAEREQWGLGYFADDRALVIKKPGELLAQRSAYELASQVKSRVVVACAQENGNRDAVPPYRFRRWLFGTSGDLSALGAMRQRIVDRLPDFVRSDLSRDGTGDLAFAMFLAELFRSGKLDDPLVTNEDLARGLETTAKTIESLATESGDTVDAAYVATNGRGVMVVTSGVPVSYRVVEGLERLPEGAPDPAMTDFKRVVAALKRFRAVVIAAHVPEGRPGWTRIEPGRTVFVDRTLEVSTYGG
ncbi:MAG: hypothetical protein RMA76_41840 [Deltaproteobacteria bacterium]|jgi:predicted glutamine amidotransferase